MVSKGLHIREYYDHIDEMNETWDSRNERYSEGHFFWIPLSAYYNKEHIRKFLNITYYQDILDASKLHINEVFDSLIQSESIDPNDEESFGEQAELLLSDFNHAEIIRQTKKYNEIEVQKLVKDLDGKKQNFYELAKHEYLQYKKWVSFCDRDIYITNELSNLYYSMSSKESFEEFEDAHDLSENFIKRGIRRLTKKSGLYFHEPEVLDDGYDSLKIYLRQIFEKIVEKSTTTTTTEEEKKEIDYIIYKYPDNLRDYVSDSDVNELFTQHPKLFNYWNRKSIMENQSTTPKQRYETSVPIIKAFVEERIFKCEECKGGFTVFEKTLGKNECLVELQCNQCLFQKKTLKELREFHSGYFENEKNNNLKFIEEIKKIVEIEKHSFYDLNDIKLAINKLDKNRLFYYNKKKKRKPITDDLEEEEDLEEEDLELKENIDDIESIDDEKTEIIISKIKKFLEESKKEVLDHNELRNLLQEISTTTTTTTTTTEQQEIKIIEYNNNNDNDDSYLEKKIIINDDDDDYSTKFIIDDLEIEIIMISFDEHCKVFGEEQMFTEFEFLKDYFGIKKCMLSLKKRIHQLFLSRFTRDQEKNISSFLYN